MGGRKLDSCNYYLGDLKLHIPDAADPSVKKWVKENDEYFADKSRLLVMTTDKEQKNEERFLEKLKGLFDV